MKFRMGRIFTREKQTAETTCAVDRIINRFGRASWHRGGLAVDGIIITETRDGKIYGSGQVDPPDRWEDFVLELETGKRLL